MLHRSKNEATVHQNSTSCEVKEFGGIGTIDGADIIINGRYPETGFSLNRESSIVVRILSGTGMLAGQDSRQQLAEGDVAFVEKGEAYYFEGQNLRFFMASTPAWNSAQYSNVE